MLIPVRNCLNLLSSYGKKLWKIHSTNKKQVLGYFLLQYIIDKLSNNNCI